MPTPVNEREGFFWSDRILLLSVAGILFLTLFPFHFFLHAKGSEGMFPFFHWQMQEGKNASVWDAVLNVLLFIPFGFGLAEKLREKGKSQASTLLLVWAAGALFSYTVEVLQIFIPSRDSGWSDVITNSSGSVVGYLTYELYGKWPLRGLRAIENAVASLLRPRWAAILLLVYFGIWFAASYKLQAATRLEGWDASPTLIIGNDTWGHPWEAWKGQVLSLEIWEHALPEAAALGLSAGGQIDADTARPLASYDLSADLSPRDSMNSLPALAWRPVVASKDQARNLAMRGQAWLASEEPVPQLPARFEETGQFSVRVVCIPTQSIGSDAHIVSIGRPGALADLNIRQDDAELVFWFRTPLSARHAQLAWIIPGVFAAGQPRDILYTYDGSSLSLFIDGKKEARPYRLGPGPALARVVRRIKPGELDGYTDIYYSLIFFPAGILLGLAARTTGPGGKSYAPADAWLLAVLLALPPVLLEMFLDRAGAHPFQPRKAVLSLAFFVAGALWINAGRRADASTPYRTAPGKA